MYHNLEEYYSKMILLKSPGRLEFLFITTMEGVHMRDPHWPQMFMLSLQSPFSSSRDRYYPPSLRGMIGVVLVQFRKSQAIQLGWNLE